MRISLVLAALAGLAAPFFGAACGATFEADQGTPIVIGHSFVLPSKILGGYRRINVYLPDGYRDPARRFPVLYLLDGGEAEDFHHITGIAQVTGAYGATQQLIVIGIESVDRKHDLTSPSDNAADQKLIPQAGGAALYRRFLVDEVKPWVAARYRTNGRSGLIGESLAGLFTIETLLKVPQSFDDYIAISPSLWWAHGTLSKDAKALLSKSGFVGKRLWVSQEDEGEQIQAPVDRLLAALKEDRPTGLSWTYDPRPAERHDTIYDPAATAAIRTLYAVAK